MPKRVPIAAAKRVAQEQGLRQVIILAWDGDLTHVVTYGQSIEDCDQAAQGGERLKTAMGWPATLNALPSRVRALQAKVAKLEEQRGFAESWHQACQTVATILSLPEPDADFPRLVREKIDALEAEISQLSTALRPFALIMGEDDFDYGDDTPVVVKFGPTTHYALKLGDLRRAAEADR